jgi:hypothetical protein
MLVATAKPGKVEQKSLFDRASAVLDRAEEQKIVASSLMKQ